MTPPPWSEDSLGNDYLRGYVTRKINMLFHNYLIKFDNLSILNSRITVSEDDQHFIPHRSESLLSSNVFNVAVNNGRSTPMKLDLCGNGSCSNILLFSANIQHGPNILLYNAHTQIQKFKDSYEHLILFDANVC